MGIMQILEKILGRTRFPGKEIPGSMPQDQFETAILLKKVSIFSFDAFISQGDKLAITEQNEVFLKELVLLIRNNYIPETMVVRKQNKTYYIVSADNLLIKTTVI